MRAGIPPEYDLSRPEVAGLAGRVLAAVRTCPHGGPMAGALPPALQPGGCRRCGEVYPCALGRGAVPGRVTTADCVACRAAALVPPPQP
jgi:hypothetical protein